MDGTLALRWAADRKGTWPAQDLAVRAAIRVLCGLFARRTSGISAMSPSLVLNVTEVALVALRIHARNYCAPDIEACGSQFLTYLNL